MRFSGRYVLVAFIVSVLVYFPLRRRLSTKPNRHLDGLDVTVASQGPLGNSSLFRSGTLKPAGHNYSRIFVTGHLPSEDISWIDRELPGLPTKIYKVNATDSELPANKGNEAMIYLTYIIDHYPDFPDVVLFMHPHEKAWHINPVLEQSNVLTVQRLLDEHVVRQGYFNTRCHHFPGCPQWLTVDQKWWRYDRALKPEERYLTGELWRDLHGFDESVQVPQHISQPCCAQFAVSGERLRQRTREEYVRYREWLLRVELRDSMTGRMFEYTWQWLFAGVWEFCPSTHQCYCEGYGVCFEGGRMG